MRKPAVLLIGGILAVTMSGCGTAASTPETQAEGCYEVRESVLASIITIFRPVENYLLKAKFLLNKNSKRDTDEHRE
jgi:hypothetical protein